MKLLIVGGVAGGASAAARARRLSEDAHIVLFERGPDVSFANCGLLQTSDPDIYAIGDAIEVKDFVSGEPTQVPLAGPANRQGRIAADNAFGRAVQYAPQYGSAKDPINMAGFVASGLLRGDHPQVDVENVVAAQENQRPFILDVRTHKEFAAVGQRGYLAARILRQTGFSAVNIGGGFNTYKLFYPNSNDVRQAGTHSQFRAVGAQ
jgi:NADH dehydrogenase FAD-containing subunit